MKKYIYLLLLIFSGLFVGNLNLNATENLSIVVDEQDGAINPTLYVTSSNLTGITMDHSVIVISNAEQKMGWGELYLVDFPVFDGGIYKIQFHNITGYDSTGVFYEVDNVSYITVSTLYENYVFNIYGAQSQLIGSQTLGEGRYLIDFIMTKDNVYPIVNSETNYITTIDNPDSETTIREGLSAIDNVDGEIPYTDFVLINDNYTPNITTIGIYEIDYKVADSSGNESFVTVKVYLLDITDPLISGINNYTQVYNNQLSLTTIKAALTASDAYDGDITSSITLKSDNYTANYNKKGSYQVVYTVKDSSNNSTDYPVTVKVVDNINPTITGTNNYQTDQVQKLSETTIRTSLSAIDDYDGPLTITLVSDNYTPNYYKIGTYQIVYRATDYSGNKTNYIVTVSVFDELPPVIYTNDAFISVDGSLNLTYEEIIQHLINVGDLEPSANLDNYDVTLNTYTTSPGLYKIVLTRNETADTELKEEIVIGVHVLGSTPITPINPEINIPSYVAYIVIAAVILIGFAYFRRKK